MSKADPTQVVQAIISRRAFWGGSAPEARSPRPPGAGDESAFAEACTGCGDSVAACPEAIIVRDGRSLPVLDFAAGACTFCNRCIDACEPGALNADAPWTWVATALPTCLSANGVTCRACQDHCEASAIRFRLRTGGCADPVIDPPACTGCGACVGACPVGAITMQHITPEAHPC